jgi:hypothetical protein
MSVEAWNMGFASAGGYKFYQGGAVTPLMVIGGQASINVGIGTTGPWGILTVVDPNIYAPSVTYGAAASLVVRATGGVELATAQDNTGPYGWWLQARLTSGAMPLLLNPAGGNVGMGTRNPAYKLDVTGDVNCTGAFRVNGTALAMVSSISPGALSGAVTLAAGTNVSLAQSGQTITITSTGSGPGAWTNYTPAVIDNLGAAVTISSLSAFYVVFGTVLFLEVSFSFTGTANTTAISIALPVSIAAVTNTIAAYLNFGASTQNEAVSVTATDGSHIRIVLGASNSGQATNFWLGGTLRIS